MFIILILLVTAVTQGNAALDINALCGFQHSNDYFRDTHETEISEFPWIARIGYRHLNEDYDEFLCIGSLITEKHILTAAQCQLKDLELTKVRLGEYHMRNESDCAFYKDISAKDCTKYQDYKVAEFLRHPDYNGTANNIALIKLDTRSVSFTDYVRPICLPQSDIIKREIGHIFLSASWGWKIVNVRSLIHYESIKLKQKINVRLATNDECTTWRVRVQENQNCGIYTNRTVCLYDNGGPLMFSYKFRWYQDGIILTGDKNCLNLKQPMIYTNIVSYIEWIKENTKDSKL